MDSYEFTASVISSLAWPSAVFGVAILMREQIEDALARLKRGKVGSVEVELSIGERATMIGATVEGQPDKARDTTFLAAEAG